MISRFLEVNENIMNGFNSNNLMINEFKIAVKDNPLNLESNISTRNGEQLSKVENVILNNRVTILNRMEMINQHINKLNTVINENLKDLKEMIMKANMDLFELVKKCVNKLTNDLDKVNKYNILVQFEEKPKIEEIKVNGSDNQKKIIEEVGSMENTINETKKEIMQSMESRIVEMKKLNDDAERNNVKINNMNQLLLDLIGNFNAKMIVDDRKFNSLKESLLGIQKRVQELGVVVENKYNDLKLIMN
jgi:nucleoside-triphosphatase THEP1